MTARAYTGPWPIRSHRTVADLPPAPQPCPHYSGAAFEVLPPVYTGPLPPPEPEARAVPLAYALPIGFTALALAQILIEAMLR